MIRSLTGTAKGVRNTHTQRRESWKRRMKKEKVQLKGQLKLYIQWPAIMSLLLIAMDLWVYKLDHRAGILMAVFVVVYIIMVGGLYFYSKNIIMKDLVEFAAQYGIVQNTLLRELSIPYAILLDDGKAIWMNDEFEAILGGKPKGEAISANTFLN